MGSRDVKAGGAFIQLSLRGGQFEKGLRNISKKFSRFGGKLAGIGAAAGGIGALAAPLASAVKLFSDFGDTIQKAALRTGFTTESLSELQFALSRSGASFAEFENAVRRFQANLSMFGRGLGAAKHAFKSLGLTFSQLSALSPDKQLELMADAISKVADPARQAAIAMAIFGRSGTNLLPLLKEGGAGIAALREEANRLGLTMSQETANKAAILNDAMGTLGDVFRAVKIEVGSALAPAISRLSGQLSEAGVAVAGFIQRNQRWITLAAKVGATFAAVSVGLIGLAVAFKAAAIGAGFLAGAFAVLTSPIIITIGAIGGVLVALGTLSEQGRRVAGFLSETFRESFQAIADALQSGNFANAGRVALMGLLRVWVTGATALEEAWLGLSTNVKNIFDNLFTSLLEKAAPFLVKLGEVLQMFSDIAGMSLSKNLDSKLAPLMAMSVSLSAHAGSSLSSAGAAINSGAVRDATTSRREARERAVAERMRELQERLGLLNTAFESVTFTAKKTSEALPPLAAVGASIPAAVARASKGSDAMISNGTFSGRAAAQIGGFAARVVEKNTGKSAEELSTIRSLLETGTLVVPVS